MPLTHFEIQAAKPRDKAYKLSDGGGLYLLIQPSGSKLWRLKYRHHGAERLLSFGSYPQVSIADARSRRDEAKELRSKGVDPAVQKKLDRIAAETAARNTFGLVVAEFLLNLEQGGAAASTIAKNKWLLEDLAKPLAHRPIAEITAAEILDLLKRIEKSGRRETARRLRGVMGSVFRLAVVTVRAPGDPTQALAGALLRPNSKPRAAITEERKFGGLLRAIDDYDGWPTIKAALKFLALTFARPGEVRGARRDEILFDKSTWRIPAERSLPHFLLFITFFPHLVAGPIMRPALNEVEFSATAFDKSASPTSSETKVWRAGASNAVVHPSSSAKR